MVNDQGVTATKTRFPPSTALAKAKVYTTRERSPATTESSSRPLTENMVHPLPNPVSYVRAPNGARRVDVVSMERPRLSVRPLSDSRFESLKALLGVNDEMKQVIQRKRLWYTPHRSGRFSQPGYCATSMIQAKAKTCAVSDSSRRYRSTAARFLDWCSFLVWGT